MDLIYITKKINKMDQLIYHNSNAACYSRIEIQRVYARINSIRMRIRNPKKMKKKNVKLNRA